MSTQARRRSLLDRKIMRRAAFDALGKLSPRLMMKNPVMFVVEIGSVLTTVLLIVSENPACGGALAFPPRGELARDRSASRRGLCRVFASPPLTHRYPLRLVRQGALGRNDLSSGHSRTSRDAWTGIPSGDGVCPTLSGSVRSTSAPGFRQALAGLVQSFIGCHIAVPLLPVSP